MMTKKKTEVDVRDQILNHLKSDERNLAWLSSKTRIPYQTLYGVLIRRDRVLTDETRSVINKSLNTKY